jgi:hypothetical protein
LLFALRGFAGSDLNHTSNSVEESHPSRKNKNAARVGHPVSTSLKKSEGWGTRWGRALAGAAPLSLAVAGAWLSNVPVGVMASYLLAAVAVAAALLMRSFAPILRAAIATALGLGLSAVYLLPAIVEQRWIAVSQATDDPGERIENSFLFARHADPALVDHDIELHKVSLIAAVLIALAIAAIIIAALRGKLTAPRRWWILLALVPLAILFLQLPISLPMWNLLPKLRFLQFPWRWLVALGAPMGIFLAAAVWPSESAKRWPRIAVGAGCVAVFAAMTALGGRVYFQPCDEEDNVAAMLDVYHSGAGFVGTSEYAPLNTDNTMIATGLPAACLVDDPTTELGVASSDPDANPAWQPAQGSCSAAFDFKQLRAKDHAEHFELAAQTSQAGFLILRLHSYPAWRIAVNGRAVNDLPQRADGLIVVRVPQGAVDVTADWTTTPDVLAGRWVSLLSLVLIAGLWFLERKLARPQLSS